MSPLRKMVSAGSVPAVLPEDDVGLRRYLYSPRLARGLSAETISFVHHSGEREDEQQDALESEVPASRVVPFADGMSAAAAASSANGDRFPAERQWHVGIGGGPVNARCVVELRIHRADGFQQLRLYRQISRRTIADHADLCRQQLLFLVASAIGNHGVHRFVQ